MFKSTREVSEETNSVGTLTLDYQLPKLWENKYLLFKPPSLWYFIMASKHTSMFGFINSLNNYLLNIYDVPDTV